MRHMIYSSFGVNGFMCVLHLQCNLQTVVVAVTEFSLLRFLARACAHTYTHTHGYDKQKYYTISTKYVVYNNCICILNISYVCWFAFC